MLAVEERYHKHLEQLLREAWEGEPSYHGVSRALGITPQTARRGMIALALEPYATLRKKRGPGLVSTHDSVRRK